MFNQIHLMSQEDIFRHIIIVLTSKSKQCTMRVSALSSKASSLCS